MHRLVRILCMLSVLMCGWSFPSHSQTVYEHGIPVEALTNFRLDTLTRTYIWFRHDVGVVDSNYMDNRASLASIRKALLEIDRDSLNAISSILVEGASSPLGHEVYNLRLSHRRAETVADFLRSIPGIGGGINIQTVAKGEDWDAFTQDIRDNYQRRNRKELLELLESDLSNWEKKTRLRTMEPDSLTWRILIRDNMNTSRHAVTIVVLKKKRIIDFLPRLKPIEGSLMTGTELVADRTFLQTPTPSPAPSPVPSPAPSSSSSTESVPQEKESRGEPLLFAFRSNLLVPALNFGAEYPIGTDWSVGADYYFPWIMRKQDNRNCFQLLGWNLEGRYWFGKNRTQADVLQGHSVGLNAAVGYYDIERNFKGNQGTFVSVGADYLYAMPIFNNKVHLEFNVGLGYIFSQMRPYEVFEEGGNAFKLGYKKNFNWVGPVKAAVSIVVPIRPEMLKWMRRKDR